MTLRLLHYGITLVLTALSTPFATQAAENSYPNFAGQWNRVIYRGVDGGAPNPGFDPHKSWGFGQRAPLTAEYTRVLEQSIADQAKGGLGNYPTARCVPGGMPRMMTFYEHEYIVTPETTYILLSGEDHYRRIFTDGRDWPEAIEPTYSGYSIGRWIDEDGDGRYDLLEVETRGFKGPRAYEASGLPLHFDNQSIFKERFFLDKNDPNVLHDEITTIDHALTRPWTVDKTYRRNPDPRPVWRENYCTEANANVLIGNENYVISGTGFLMPAKRDQPPPDLRHFTGARK